MVDAGQLTIILIPAEVAKAPGLGAQVVRMVLIGQERMPDTVSIDGQDSRSGEWSPMTQLGHSPRGLVLLLMLVSHPPRWGHTVGCVLFG